MECSQVSVYFAIPILIGIYTLVLHTMVAWWLRARMRTKPEAQAAAMAASADQFKSNAIRTILALLFLGYVPYYLHNTSLVEQQSHLHVNCVNITHSDK